MESEEAAYTNLNKRIFNLIKRFEKQHGVFVQEVEYIGDMDGSKGEELSQITSSIMFCGATPMYKYETKVNLK